MAPTITNLIVGLQTNNTVKVGTYGTVEGSCDELGLTEGGIEVANAREYYERKADQYMNVLDVDKISERMTVKFSVAESTLENLAKAWDYPAGAIAGGTVLTASGTQARTQLTLFVNCKSIGGNSRKYEFPKVICLSAGTHSYKKDDKTLIEFEFLVMHDASGICIVTDSGTDVTAPTVALTTPTDGNTVADSTTDPVIWTLSEECDPNSIVYGDGDNGTFLLLNTTVAATADIEPGTIVYDPAGPTVTFTPAVAWNSGDTFQALVTTGLRDLNGNHLAATKVEQFSAT